MAGLDQPMRFGGARKWNRFNHMDGELPVLVEREQGGQSLDRLCEEVRRMPSTLRRPGRIPSSREILISQISCAEP